MADTRLPISPFIDETQPRFKLDEGAFMAEIADTLAGLTLGRDAHMRAGEMMPIVEVIAGHAA